MTSVAISVSALLFTVFSFWWMHWRPGRLVVTRPRSFAVGGFKGQAALRVALPLVFLNRGARPLVLTNLRLLVSGPGLTGLTFAFNDVASSLARDAPRTMAIPFHVPGNQAVAHVCEFVRIPGDPAFQVGTYRAELQARLQDSPKWTTVLTAELPITPAAADAVAQGMYIAMDADAEALTLPGTSPNQVSPPPAV